MLSQLEQIEKKNQQQMKDKDRVFLEEKNKLNKKIEQLTQENKSLLEQI